MVLHIADVRLRFEHHHYISRDQARANVFDYIERFYNPRRLHSTLQYVSPVRFEELHRATV